MPGLQSIQGLASNLDIDSIVNTIIEAERRPVALLEADQELKTKQVAAYQAVAAKFLALKSHLATMLRRASFEKYNIRVSDESVLSATANGSVADGSYALRVLSLATNHQIATHGFDSPSAATFGTGTLQISVGDASPRTINIEAGKNSLLGIKDAINAARIGVTASIINDGTASKPYRLILTADKTGLKNSINISQSLTGGESLDFSTAIFDNPEEIITSTGSSSTITLGSSAVYTGATNKTYTFTVAGNGSQTIGTDNITINWTDGANSGSILVTQSDTEYELTGNGSDGLRLQFSAGTLNAGDTFQVSTFAPLLQSANDAQVAIGGNGSGSPIVVSSATNTFTDLIPGLRLDLKKISDPGATISIQTSRDTSSVRKLIDDFIAKYNDVMDFIDEQNTYNQDTKESGVLFSDFSLQVMQSSLRTTATSVIAGLTGGSRSLASLGIRSNMDGRLAVMNSATLNDAISNNFEDFLKVFIDSGQSSSSFIEFISAGTKTVDGQKYDVDITRAATKGFFQGTNIADPSLTPLTLTETNNMLKLRIDGVVSNDIVLTPGIYSSGDDLATELQTRIDADSKIKALGVRVEWVNLGETGYLKLTSGSYGSTSKVEMYTSIANSAFATLGLATGLVNPGLNVEGTINGETATGSGQILTGNEGNRTTDGLKLKITLENSSLVNGAEGSITLAKGISSRLDKVLDNITKSIDGSIARRTSALNNQIDNIKKQIEDYDERLAARKESLYKQFLEMESALSEYQAQGAYLESQLANLSNLFSGKKKES